jgi:nitrate reductase gamma subunit
MKVLVSLTAVTALALIAFLGSGAGVVFGVVIPYLAIGIFLVGVTVKVTTWARAPVPYRIPTVSGQAKSLDWVRHDKFDSPANGWQVVVRMALEVLFFRSLFRNTKAELKAGPRLVYGGDKFLWLGAMVFHWTFLVVFLRHLRFFTEPVPGCISFIDEADSFFEIGVPPLYITGALLLGSVFYLLGRRLLNPQVKYISLASDYFPLFLLIGIATSGILLRYFVKTDIVGIKELGVGLLSFSPKVPEAAGGVFTVHLFLVCSLIAYFPFSKLMHLGGVFLSPTRNLANNNRAVRHVNPDPQPVKFHEFDEWMEEYAEEIAEAGYKLERD